MSEGKPQALGPYVIQRILGEGTTGKVKLAYHRETGQQVAIKIISKSAFDHKPNLQTKVQREIALMRVIDHPNVLKLIDVLESSRHLCIVLEYAHNGELFDFLVERHYLPVEMAMDFFRQIVLAIEYLHYHGICHRDLKPENILLDSHHRIKIADFGFARWVKSRVTETSCGSPHYAAPEVIRGIPYDGKKADIWSLGIILFALLAGYLPFDDPSIRVVLHKVKKGQYEMPQFQNDIQHLISHLIVVDPDKRLTIEQIKASPAFRRNLDKTYILPSPMPDVTSTGSIDPSTISKEMMQTLVQIGFNDPQELNEQLMSEDRTMAKIFVSMLTAKLDLEQLPWEECSHSKKNIQLASSESAELSKDTILTSSDEIDVQTASPDFSNTTIESGIDDQTIDRFHRHKTEKLPQSMDIHSMATRPNWAICDDADSALTSSVLKITDRCFYGKTIWTIMSRCQNILNDNGYQWIHPNPLTIYARSVDIALYFSITGEFKEMDEISISIKLHKGDDQAFNEITGKLFQAIDEPFSFE